MTADIPADCAAKYRPVRLLGEGGYGQVWLAEQIGLGRQVALKVLRADAVGDDEQRERFMHEGRIAAQIEHPNVVRVIDSGVESGVPWLVYEFVEGKSLREKVHEQPMRWTEALDVASQIADALEAAHRRQIIHRDVKAENVLQGADGVYKLADFGIAKWSGETGVKTRTGFVVGTPSHLAPELIKGLAPSPASDVYALGVLLFELLTGRLPFDSPNLGVLMTAHLERPVPTPTRLQPDLPARLNDVLKRALEKEPSERIASAGALREELRAVLHSGAPDATLRPRRAISASGAHTLRASRASLVSPKESGEATPPRRARLAVAAAALAALYVGTARRPGPVGGEPSPSATLSPSPARVPDEPPELAAAWTEASAATTLEGQVILEARLRRRGNLLPMNGVFVSDAGETARTSLMKLATVATLLEQHHVTGSQWHMLAVFIEAVVLPFSDNARAFLKFVDRPLVSVRAHLDPGSADPYRADAAAIVQATVDLLNGTKGLELPLARAYARALATYATTGDQTIDHSHFCDHRMTVAHQLQTHAQHAYDPHQEPHLEVLPALEQVLDAVAKTADELPSSASQVAVDHCANIALNAVMLGAHYEAGGMLRAERYEPALRGAARLLRRSTRKALEGDARAWFDEVNAYLAAKKPALKLPEPAH